MKQLFIATITLLSFSIQAQNNTLLDRGFWKKNPTVQAVDAEIKKGNNPTELNSNAFDPTVLAINEQASNEVIRHLLAIKGNDVNKLTHDGRTYIFWAAWRGNIEIMEHLLKNGAKTNIFDDKGYSALNFAASAGQANTKVYDLLIENGINVKTDKDNKGANALLLAAPHDKDFTLTNYFIGKGLDLNSTDKEGNTAFNYAARVGNIETLKALISKGVKYTDNAMLIASQGGRGTSNTLEVYQYLAGLKINPNAVGKNGENVFHSIVRKDKQEEIIAYFLSKGVDLNKADNDGNTPFMNAAASNNDVKLIANILQTVKDINQKNSKGVTALALAVKGNTPEVVSLILQKGADVKVIDRSGENLSSYLIQSYNPEKKDIFEAKAKLLADKGFKIETQQKNGNTLYHLAVAKNDAHLVKLVGGYKSDINIKNNEGMTALHKAALIAKDDTVLKQLLVDGAKKDVKTEMGETAYDLASENEYLTQNKVSIDFLK
ncbi:ankyrin repeat domain-containing protein [Flavobacterium sp. PLA-1-15]|uniref:ankyrin repeat domain-containing protein n=1 Tax=Flavobacterium sp. PLA-1-15 TaxID=3380533 RepID=UPI003B7EE143